MSWRESAACRELAGWWFQRRPADKDKARVHDEARKTICRSCPVLQECREEARRLMEPSGVWGGESPEERCSTLSPTRGPVPRGCASCGKMFTPFGHGGSLRQTCSDVCYERNRAAQKAGRVQDTARPCPRCETSQNMKNGVCMGWECERIRGLEARRRVAS